MKKKNYFLAMVLTLSLLPVTTNTRAEVSPENSMATEHRTVGATIDPNIIIFYFNWDNTNPELTITWNDATQVTGMSYYDGDDNWVSLPNTIWQVVNDDGTTATLIIFLDQSPAKVLNTREGEHLVGVQEWRVEFDLGPPALGYSHVYAKTFFVTFDVKDAETNPIPNLNIYFWPYMGNDNPGSVWDTSNFPIFEVAARRDYQYYVDAPGFGNAQGYVLNIEQDFTIDIILPEQGPTHSVTFDVVGGNGHLGASVDGFYVGPGSQVEEGKDVIFQAYPYGGYTIKEWKLNNEVLTGVSGLTYAHLNLQEDIYVTVEFQPYQFPSISPETQFFALQQPTDLDFEISWGSESEILFVSTWVYDEQEDEYYEFPLVAGTDYLLAGNTLTIKADFILSLNPEPYTWIGFNVRFGLGGYGWFGVIVIPTFLPSIYPTELEYDLSNPADAMVTIVYNMATEVTSATVGGVPLVHGTDYHINGSWLFIHQSYLALALPEVDDEVIVSFVFDTGANIDITITAIQSGVVNAAIAPDFVSFYEHEFPDFVDVEITWNSATAVTGLDVLVAFQWGVDQFPWDAYQVTDHGDGTATLRIFFGEGKKAELFAKKGEKAEDYIYVTVNIHFDVGAPAKFLMLIIDQYFYVNVAVVPDGAGWISGDYSYRPGEMVELSAGAHWSYQFLQWEDMEGAVVSTDNPWYFSMPENDVNLVARYARSYFVHYFVMWGSGQLTATANGEQFFSGEQILGTATLEFSATPDMGFTVQEWHINNQIVPANQSNTLIVEGFQSDVSVGVIFMDIPYQGPSISPDYKVFSLGEPQDVEFFIDWGSETEILFVSTWIYDEIEDEYYQLELTPGVDYLVDENILTIASTFILSLNPEPFDWLSFNVQFGLGGYGWFNIVVVESTLPSLNPPALSYDLSNPGDVMTTINFAFSEEVVSISVSGVNLIPGTDYHINGVWLFIHNSYLSAILQQVDDEIILAVEFDTQAQLPLTITAIESGVINATIDPTFISFYEHEFPEYTDITITWNDASAVTGLTVLVVFDWQMEEFDYPFYEVTDNGDGTANLRIFFMDGEKAVQIAGASSKAEEYIFVTIAIHFDVGASANFLMKIIYEYYMVNVTIVPEYAGWVWGDWDYSPGEEVELGASPNWGFEFSHWEDMQGNLVSTDNPYYFIMPSADVNLVAVFLPYYFVNYGVAGSPNGSISASVDGVAVSDGQMVLGGSTVLFTAVPNSGYMVKEWRVNNQVVELNQSETLEVVLSNNIMVTVEFQPIPPGSYQIHYNVLNPVGGTLTASTNGNVVANGQYVAEGSDITFTANAASGYQVMEWMVNGVVYQDDSEPYTGNVLTIENLEANLTVTLEFEASPVITYTVTFLVEDQQGVPILDAIITLGETTNSAGNYVFTGMEPGVYDYIVEKEGYFDAIGELTIINANINITVIMEVVPQETFSVTFNVNMTYAAAFNPASDVVYLAGSLLGWAQPGNDPDNQTMSRVGESMIWTKTLELEAGTYAYKYFLNAGWGGGEWQGGDDRSVTVDADMEVNDWFGSLTDPTTVNYPAFDRIRIFPVPAHSKLTIISPEEMRDIRIVDIVGQIIYSASAAGLRHEINVGGFKNGIYFIQVFYARGIETRRIQIQK